VGTGNRLYAVGKRKTFMGLPVNGSEYLRRPGSLIAIPTEPNKTSYYLTDNTTTSTDNCRTNLNSRFVDRASQYINRVKPT
jgi:hypothetical protein